MLVSREVAARVSDPSDDRLYRTIAGVVGVAPETLNEDSSPETVPAWDSLNHLNIVMALEGEFGISLSVDDTLEMHNVGVIRSILGKYGVENHMASVVFVDCNEDQLPALQDFFARMYRPDYVLAVNADYFRWQFGDTPISKREDFHMRIALVNGEITGCLGYIPLEISLGGQITTGAWLANWMVDPNSRQVGLGPLLVREIMRDFDFILAAGPNKDAQSFLSRMGWTDFGRLPRYVSVLDQQAAGALTESGALDWPTELLPNDLEIDPDTTVKLVDRYSDDATQLWDRTTGKSSGGTRRSADFLNWRYVDHSVFDYRLFEVHRGGQLSGFAVYRVEQVRDVPVKVGRIVEFVADKDSEGDLLNAVLNDAKSQGCAALDFFCSSNQIADVFTSHGFLTGEHEAASQIPVLFQPIDRRRAGVLVMADLQKVSAATGVTDWYFTKADGDQDRPN